MSEIKYTPTQRRMLKVLSDGKPHTRKELFACLSDDLAKLCAIKYHLTHLRNKLRPQGQDVICLIQNRRVHYQHVHVLPVNQPKS